MGVGVGLFEPGLMHVLVGVLSAVVVRVRVLVLDVLVLMRGVGVAVRRLAMLVFVRMRSLVAVLLCHREHLLLGCLSTRDRRLLGNDP